MKCGWIHTQFIIMKLTRDAKSVPPPCCRPHRDFDAMSRSKRSSWIPPSASGFDAATKWPTKNAMHINPATGVRVDPFLPSQPTLIPSLTTTPHVWCAQSSQNRRQHLLFKKPHKLVSQFVVPDYSPKVALPSLKCAWTYSKFVFLPAARQTLTTVITHVAYHRTDSYNSEKPSSITSVM